MDGTSLNITQDLINKLKEVVPQAFTEDKIDIQRLQTLLGQSVSTDSERYGLSWAGKSEAYKVLQSPSTATLIPNPDQSIDWDNAENVFIEGENLEVLKVLQKSYYGKVKMIYIDPPYNTGNDSFIYPDKFSETKEEYLKRIGDKDDDGFMMKQGLFRKNNKENGQFHSNWLNMMLPRLFLARNLLKDDGVIFVSIDDNEQANLKILMDEIFGEENFLTTIIWEKRFTKSNNSKMFGSVTEFILCYRKTEKLSTIKEPRNEKSDSIYSNPDNDPRGDWTSVSYVNPATKEQRQNLVYKIINPITNKEIEHPTNAWKYEYSTHLSHVEENKLYWGTKGENTYPRLKKFLSEMDGGMVPSNLWYHKEVGTTDQGSKILNDLLEKSIFDFPKPPSLIKKALSFQINDKEDKDFIVLDFFAGSGTTAQAVLELNEADGGNRKFICVQLPELTDDKSEASKAGHKTIADISKTRIEKVIEKITKERDGKLELDKHQNLGFRKYTLASSNFKIWRGDVVENEEDLVKQMELFTTPQKENTRSEHILWELLIKNGVPLTEKIECSTLQDGATIYYTANKKLAFVLDKYSDEVQTAVLELKPKNIICLDSLFHNNDNVKTNAQLKFEDNGISFKTI
ncbi:site-specific DNA-methyltransferase [Runella limosa]|uniref:site-specific DNA-methyltransferase n=1 Tax=Runella limosa TaxID=370978 RepID=UPI0003FD4BC0|nr:site-specific DNA-methyltransferase [Runella limosa]